MLKVSNIAVSLDEKDYAKVIANTSVSYTHLEIKDSSFAYKGRQECKECHSVYQIHFPSGAGFIPIIIAFIPALYMVTSLRYSFVVGLAMFVLFYWAIDIIMNHILIYLGKYEIEEVE